jgi:sporulation protein YlmC with PRC-barrel domain
MMLTHDIKEMEVIGSDGWKLGEVEDTQFDEKEWRVLAIEVALEKDVAKEHNLGRHFRKTRVLINVEHVQAVGEKVILKGSKEELLKLIATSPMVRSEEKVEQEGSTVSFAPSTPDSSQAPATGSQ